MASQVQKKTIDLFRTIAAIATPPPELTVSEWAAAKRDLPDTCAEPGPWRNERTPYLVEVMDSLTDPKYEGTVVMSAAQMGKSECGINFVGYSIDQDPSTCLIVLPTGDDVLKFARERFRPLVKSSKDISGIIDLENKNNGNRLDYYEYPGGFLGIVGAHAGSPLASRFIRRVYLDEIDRYPLDVPGEGDPVTLVYKRTTTFFNKKLLYTSTPTDKETSRINKLYLDSTQEVWMLPCPTCEHEQVLSFERLNHETLTHACEECGASHAEIEWKTQTGRWVALNPDHQYRRGFHLNGMYSPWCNWLSMVRQFNEAKELGPEGMRAFCNTTLGLVYEEPGETADANVLYARREEYGPEVPARGLYLTLGVDTQNDRLVCETVAWGIGEECWSMNFKTLWGDPNDQDVWDQLDELRATPLRHANGHIMSIMATGIDSGGSRTDAVYNYCRGKEAERVFCLKGQGGPRPVIKSPSVVKAGAAYRRPVKLYVIGVDEAKDTIMSRLLMEDVGPGYCHFSKVSVEGMEINDEEYFAQLCAEKKIMDVKKTGFSKREWTLVRANKRNEAFDCRVYAFAVLKAVYPKWGKLARAFGRRVIPIPLDEEQVLQDAFMPPAPLPEKPPEVPPPLAQQLMDAFPNFFPEPTKEPVENSGQLNPPQTRQNYKNNRPSSRWRPKRR